MLAFTRLTKVRLTNGCEYPIEAVDFELREVKYYNDNDAPIWVPIKRIAAIV